MDAHPATTLAEAPGQAAFRAAFRRHAAGVAVVTTRDAQGSPVGFTATSLASVSADPPLASFSLARTASSAAALATADHVAIHVLGARDRHLAERLSGPASERFAGDHWSPGPHGLPVLAGGTALLVARIVERVPVHDAIVVVVRIEDGGAGVDDDPLVYHARRYLRPGAEA
ncbi:flavin reductase family protein [Clavibacter michiganensis subsp. phaseoli]|uniref:flavin reductase family protein n=1 Tax=Clavibacter phaseoli TaxID=1734031 RepID=UPI001FB3E61D|nr:flavin reductase family protein [Clavibacter phaseoli]MCJ1711348.1 flavin reductase family protein [Clavibacter phaseoli]